MRQTVSRLVCFQTALWICRPGCYEQSACVMNNILGGCTIPRALVWSEAPVAWPDAQVGAPSPVLMFLLLPSPGGTSQGFACCRTKSFPHVFPSGLNSYLICHSNISCRGMLNSKWHAQKNLLTACIVNFCYGFISDTRTLARIGCTRSLNRITGTSMRNFYQDNHIYTTTCASTTLSSRVGVIHLPQAAKGNPQMDFEWHPGRADTMQGVRSCVSWERLLSPASARARRCHRVQTQDDAEQVSGGTETARNQHLLVPAKFLLTGINCKNKNAARHTSPKWLLTNWGGEYDFFHIPDHDGNTFKCGIALRERGLLCCASVTSERGLFT